MYREPSCSSSSTAFVFIPELHHACKAHGKLGVMTAQPLLGSLHVGTEALHGQPELRRMIGDDQMHDFVRNELVEYEIRPEN